MSDWGTSGGVPISEAVIERAAAEAEAGYPLDQLRPRGEAPPAYFGPGDAVNGDEMWRLPWGTVIDRHTYWDREALVVFLPCCDPQSVYRSRQKLASDLVSVCRKCETAYRIEYIDDNDGGYTARLTYMKQDVQVSRVRRMKR